MLLSIPVQQRSIEAIPVFLDASPGKQRRDYVNLAAPAPPWPLISQAFCLLLLAPRAGPASPSYLPTKLGEARTGASDAQQ